MFRLSAPVASRVSSNRTAIVPVMPSPATHNVPDAAGRFGTFGGRYVPETLTRALDELAAEYAKAKSDPKFQAELDDLLRNYVGRPSAALSCRAAEQANVAGPRFISSAKT